MRGVFGLLNPLQSYLTLSCSFVRLFVFCLIIKTKHIPVLNNCHIAFFIPSSFCNKVTNISSCNIVQLLKPYAKGTDHQQYSFQLTIHYTRFTQFFFAIRSVCCFVHPTKSANNFCATVLLLVYHSHLRRFAYKSLDLTSRLFGCLPFLDVWVVIPATTRPETNLVHVRPFIAVLASQQIRTSI